jgi:hypothetical protein
LEEALEHLRAAGAAPGPAAELTTFAGLAVHRSF